MSRMFSKQIADPLYGTIGLTPIEVDVIGTRVFQRLSRINQLGTAHLVFPGAQYSRFEHSIGVCHVAGQILASLESTPDFSGFTDDEWQKYRLAALLHDVGHYPFSHAFENALDSAYDEYYEHEAVGGQILQHDRELQNVINNYDFDFSTGDIAAIFLREKISPNAFTYADLLSSGLDADRLDYLRRTAHHTGVPYGSIDGDYLVSQFHLVGDKLDTIALTHRARLTADHFLLSRWFEYQQVIFHHTVQAADSTLEDILEKLFERNDQFAYTSEDVRKKIHDGTWADFDDVKTMEAIRSLQADTEQAESGEDKVIHDKCRALLERRLPKSVYECSCYQSHTNSDNSDPLTDDALESLANSHGIDRDLWTLWTARSPFTKMNGDKEHDIRVSSKDVPEESEVERLVDDDQALVSRLANEERYTWRLYVLFPHDWDEECIENTREKIRNDLTDNYLTDQG